MEEAQGIESQVAPESGTEAQSNEVQQEATASTAPVETPPPVQEKMIPQSQVSKIAAREARQAAEKARNEARLEFERAQTGQAIKNDQPVSQMGGIPQLSPEQLEQHILSAAHRMSAQMTADKMAKDFESKVQAEIESDPDFGDLYDSLNITQHPELVIWMNGMDNSAKVLKDLAQNPAKFANILMLSKSGLPQLAQKELTKLHDSIKTNQQALSQPKSNEPLDHLSPTSVGVGSGEMSVSDFQKMDWLRG